jgi:hypothetical protein
MRVEDVVAIKAYLFTLPPVRASVPDNNVGFSYSWRGLMRGWKLLYLEVAPSPETVKGRSAEWVRGANLWRGQVIAANATPRAGCSVQLIRRGRCRAR